jgi:hypothetical protein
MVVEREAKQWNAGQQKQKNGGCVGKPPGKRFFHRVTPSLKDWCERLIRQSMRRVLLKTGLTLKIMASFWWSDGIPVWPCCR